MKALALIIEREYTSRVKTKAFLVTTILVPILMLVCTGLPAFLMSLNSSDISKVYVIDETGLYTNLLDSIDGVKFEYVPDGNFEKQANESYATLIIQSDLTKNPNAVTFYSEKQKPPREIMSYINTTLSKAVKNKQVTDFSQESNIAPEAVAQLQQIFNSKDAVKVSTIRLGEDGQEKDTLGEVAMFVGMAFTFVMFFFIMSYGSMVMQSVIEEKSNRIVEVIVSSVRPFDLMMGKIIGVGLTGITQLLVWVVLFGVALGAGSFIFGAGEIASITSSNPMTDANTQELVQAIGDSAMGGMMATLLAINWVQVFVCFILYFIGGYLIFASLFAMFGSAANDAQEAQQFTMPVLVILMLAFYCGFASTNNPEGSMAFWASMIPFTSPVVMMVRTPFEIPLWELASSLLLLFATAILMVKLAGKIYRTGILMTGKKVSFLEMFKWLNYK